jgi:hypothetical protein
MNLQEIIAKARLELDDPESPGGGDDSDSNWSDAELTFFANRAVEEACFRSRLLLDSTTPETCIIDVVSGQHSYPISPKLTNIRRVHMLGNQMDNAIEQTSRTNLDNGRFDRRFSTTTYQYRSFAHSRSADRYDNYRWEHQEGLPQFYLLDLNALTIRFFRIPTSDYTATLTVERMPLADMVDPALDEPEIPSQYHYDLISWIRHLAFLKRDDDTINGPLSQKGEADFTRVFGNRPDASWDSLRLRGKPRECRAQFV